MHCFHRAFLFPITSAIIFLLLTYLQTSQAALQSPGTDRLIIKYAQPVIHATEAEQGVLAAAAGTEHLQNESVRVVRAIATGANVMQLEKRRTVQDMDTICQSLAQQPGILYAEPDHIMHHHTTPNDPLYNHQWHYFEPVGGINLPAAWDKTTGDPHVNVAVIDTGVLSHRDLKDNLLPGYDFIKDIEAAADDSGRDPDASDPGDFTPAGFCGFDQYGLPSPQHNAPSSWHGTHVAGTIAATGNNNEGVTGVSWHSRILPIRVLGRCGGYTSDITDGMLWAAGIPVPGMPENPHPAKVLNLSLGGEGTCTRAYRDAIKQIREKGATIVVAAGNENRDARHSCPANCEGVITVAATNRDGARAYYSNFGTDVDIAAPGGELEYPENGILSTYNSGTRNPGTDTYASLEGTSMATPHVSGVVAQMYSVNNTLTPDQVESILKTTAREFPTGVYNACTTGYCGAGIIDAGKAVNSAAGQTIDNTHTLRKGIAKSALHGNRDTPLIFTLDLAASVSNLTFTLSGGSGDADLYVSHNQPPTLESHDCRSAYTGNDEHCRISQASAGRWYAMVYAYSPFRGVSLLADYDGEEPTESQPSVFRNTTSMLIPDRDNRGVTSSLYVSRTGLAGTPELTLDISHPFKGDLRVVLISPNGQRFLIKGESASESGADLKGTWTVKAQNLDAQGVWKLQVADLYYRDTGRINSWQLNFH
ncbi:S8 family serine peptidase [Kistimonas asteriae]|uniref:S8 family serine peptidase n=1 Tax=Kistimonas asteriae TaxID=517724 RepID=UPI001BA91EE1|nr:S8 family serine peptidase [Kistimonas asteriae]